MYDPVKLVRMLMKPEIMDQISLEGEFLRAYVCDGLGSKVLFEKVYYLTAPKCLVEDWYPNAESTTFSITIPTVPNEGDPPGWPVITISPTKDGSDYDVMEIQLPYDIVENFMKIIEKENKS